MTSQTARMNINKNYKWVLIRAKKSAVVNVDNSESCSLLPSNVLEHVKRNFRGKKNIATGSAGLVFTHIHIAFHS